MTWAHPPADLLTAFATGSLDGSDGAEAVRVALHLDDCPACAARAASLEPLAHVFASVDAPAVPADLAAAVLMAADAPEAPRRSPRFRHTAEVAVAGSLLCAAFALLVLLGAPGELIVGGLALVGALAATGASLAASMASPVATATFIAGVGLAASVATVRNRSTRARRAA